MNPMSLELLTHLAQVAQVLPELSNVPNPNPTAPPGGDKLQTLLNWGAWIAALVCLGGVLVAAGVMAWSHSRGMGGNEGTTRLGWAMVGCIIVGSASAIVGALV
jgi:hypothetical protein